MEANLMFSPMHKDNAFNINIDKQAIVFQIPQNTH